MTPTILIVEDDKDFAEYTKRLLSANGYLVEVAAKGSEALLFVKKIEPDLIVLDLTLPDMTGESVCMEIRKSFPALPIVILSAKNAVAEKVLGLTLGADDYITKPFVPDEFMARIKTRLRPQTGTNNNKMVIADLELDTKKIEVTRGKKKISLTPQEFKLLEYLMSNPGTVLSREMILNHIWAYSLDVESRVVDVYMGYLRKKIDTGFKKKLMHSVRGFGYTIKE
ncbi:MAG: response regulator transcription factor [Patescibacteria group bacterium]